MKKYALLLIALFLVVIIASCAATAKAAPPPTTTTTATVTCDGGHHFLAKTKFVARMGLAIGLFHRYIYKPFKAGSFKSGAAGRTKAFIKAGASGALIIHELHEACKDAQAAGGSFAKLVTPLSLLQTQVGTLAAKIKSGHFKPGDILSAETAITAVSG